jgi:Flp pilus assembly protein TadD
VRPSDPEVLYALATALVDAGRPDEAVEVFDQTVALDPMNEDAVFSRAVTLLDLGRVDEAVFALDAYVRTFPNGQWTDRARSILYDMTLSPEGGD